MNDEKEILRRVFREVLTIAVEEIVRAGVAVMATKIVVLPSLQDDGAEGRGYNKALIDAAHAIESAGYPIANDPRVKP